MLIQTLHDRSAEKQAALPSADFEAKRRGKSAEAKVGASAMINLRLDGSLPDYQEAGATLNLNRVDDSVRRPS